MHQIGKAAGYEEQAAQGIFQRTTVHPGVTAIGQVQFKVPSTHFAFVNLQVPMENGGGAFTLERTDTR